MPPTRTADCYATTRGIVPRRTASAAQPFERDRGGVQLWWIERSASCLSAPERASGTSALGTGHASRRRGPYAASDLAAAHHRHRHQPGPAYPPRRRRADLSLMQLRAREALCDGHAEQPVAPRTNECARRLPWHFGHGGHTQSHGCRASSREQLRRRAGVAQPLLLIWRRVGALRGPRAHLPLRAAPLQRVPAVCACLECVRPG